MNDPVNHPLQDFSFEHSQYQRPNQPVVYVPLPDGEDVVSHGPELYQQPLAAVGGTAKPMLKSRSLRKRRGIFSLAMTALTLSFLLIAFNSPWSKELIAPGPLSSPHAQIMGKLGSDRCAACHHAANESFGQWMMRAVGASSSHAVGNVIEHEGSVQAAATHQSQLCMKCHSETLDAAFALNPHGASIELLDQLTLEVGGGRWASDVTHSVATRLGMSHGSSIACSACHREHHGRVSLSQLTDQQCQSCHQKTFASFEDGHPEFSMAAQQRRQRIAFDHGTHLNKHFPANKTSFDCAQCHMDDLTGSTQRTAPFEQSCGACHQQQIADSGDRGWAIFSLPMIDMEAVKQHGLTVGNWPLAATGDFDGPLPPMMGVLLAADSKVQVVLDRLGKDFVFGDIDPDDKASVMDAVELVWGIKRLLKALADGGRDCLREKFSSATGKSISSETMTQILAGLDPQIFSATAKRWLPDLDRDLAADGSESAASKSGVQLRPAEMAESFAATVQGRLVEQELLAENPLSEYVFGTSEFAAVIEDVAVGDEAVESSRVSNGTGTPGRRQPQALPEGSELLVDNPLQSNAEFSLSLGDSSLASRGKSGGSGSGRGLESPLALKVPDEIHIVAQNKQVTFRPGWFRSDSQFVIGYRPADHADPLVKSWSDLAATATTAEMKGGRHTAMDRLFSAVTSTSGTGGCRSCHTVDKVAGGGFEFQWTASGRDVDQARFTKFTHRPHLILPQLQECKSCHRMNDSASLIDAFNGFESMVSSENSSNFHPSTKADCANCHRKGYTDGRCMQCHNYHVGHKQKD